MAGTDLDNEEHVQALQRDRAVDVEEVTGQHRDGLGAQELPPGRTGTLGSGRDPQPLQDTPHRRSAYLDAEPEQLALDPLVPPPRVLPSHLPTSTATLASTGGRPARCG
jgi:hypothetical protein